MADDDRELVERLFAMADEYDSGHHESWPTIDALEIAAHRIEALSKENERMREALTLCAKHVDWMPHPHCVDVEAAIRAALGEMK